MFIFILINLINLTYADLIKEPDFLENHVPLNNIIASTFWAMSVCSCVGIVCNHKKKIPIKVEPKEIYGKDFYEISSKNEYELHRLKEDLKEMKNVIQNLENELKENEKQKIIQTNNISMEIPDNIKYNFGKAPIRFKQNGKYYHGIDPTYYASWDKTSNWTKEHIGCMWHYKNHNVKVPHPEWDTHNIDGFCLNCSYCTEGNKKKKSRFIYRCNGHII
jgi:hypothetical protein